LCFAARVELDALNFFMPFRRLEPNHENQLTRALLVILRLSPMAHAAWLRLMSADHDLHGLPVATFLTQTRALRQAGDRDEPAALVSVFLAPEAPLSGGGVITESDRGQVLDAVIDYGGELLVVVENKVAEADDLQARHLNVAGARVRLAEGQEAVVVLWRDVLDAFIALRERNLVAGAEAGVLDDFLTYTEDHFADLGPFRTLALTHGNPYRQTRRLRQVLGQAVGLDAQTDVHGAYVKTPAREAIGAKTYLRMTNENEVELALFPADPLSQARVFYARPKTVTGLKSLSETPHGQVIPNFHFGHMQRGLCWTHTERDVNEYVKLWAREIGAAHAIARKDWDEYWACLVGERIATQEDRSEFDRCFTDTHRQTASPRPGVRLSRRWPLGEAEALDTRGRLDAQVRQALDTALEALGEPHSTKASEPKP
jgi:hypothetical protein